MTATLLAAGEYVPFMAWWKLVPLFVFTPIWLKLLTWVDKDTKRAHLNREGFNLAGLGSFILAAAAYFLVPNIFISIPVFLAVFAGVVIMYLTARSKTVGLDDLSKEFKEWLSTVGRKKKEEVVPVGLTVLSGKNGTLNAPVSTAPERPIYDAVQGMIADPLRLGADRIDVRPSGDGMVVRYQVDGVTYDAKPIQRDIAVEAIALVKQMAGMDPDEVRRPQTGKAKAATDKRRNEIDVYTAGSTAGESMKLIVDLKKQYDRGVEDLGLLPEQLKTIDESIKNKAGIVLLSSPDGQGLTNLSYAMLRRHDAFLSHLQTVERDPVIDLEGVKQNKLPTAATAVEESKLVSWIISQEPDVIFINRIDEPRSAADLIKFGESGRRVYVALRAGSTFEAIQQWRKIVGDDALALKELVLAINGRLVRKLCKLCKIAYAPDPDALKKMNMSPDKVQQLFQARKEPLRDQKGNPMVCEECNGLAFKGRSGVFELVSIDDETRQALLTGINAKQLKVIGRKQKQRDVQEAALAKVEAGDTSIDEVLRVIRATSSAPTARAATPAVQ